MPENAAGHRYMGVGDAIPDEEKFSPLAAHEAEAKKKAAALRKTVDAMYPPQTKKQTSLELVTEAINELGTEGGEGVGIKGTEEVTMMEDEKNMAKKRQEENAKKAWERNEVERQAREQLGAADEANIAEIRKKIDGIGGKGENTQDNSRSNTPAGEKENVG